MKSTIVDDVNVKTMKGSVKNYDVKKQLHLNEQAALNSIKSDVMNMSILDIGIGGGRTVIPLLEISKDYVGVDYVAEMVACSRKNYPGIRFEQADARNLSLFSNNTFGMVMFSLNGISMVDHDGRISILKEVYRVLKSGGFFLFSTYNSDSKEYKRLFQFPRFEFTPNPAKFVVRSYRFFKNTIIGIKNRVRLKKYEETTPDYSIINDRCHNYSTMFYYLSLENQIKQLRAIGFEDNVTAFDFKGNIVHERTFDNSIFYVAQKPDHEGNI